MFLTQMHLNPARRGTRQLLSSPQRMHAAVMAAFPPDLEPSTGTGMGEGRVLWRIDRNQHAIALYISSPAQPDLTHLVEQAGWPASATNWRTTPTDAFQARLETDQEWVFRLTANPVHTVRGADGARGKRLAHVTIEQQEQWLHSRAEARGFKVISAAISRRETVTFTRRTDGQGRKVTLAVATYDGLLRVTDPDQLRATLASGIGRAKGYGCGLMTLAPPR